MGSTSAGKKRKKPSQMRYTSEERWVKNKRKKAQKTANKRGQIVKIKVRNAWEEIHPK